MMGGPWKDRIISLGFILLSLPLVSTVESGLIQTVAKLEVLE